MKIPYWGLTGGRGRVKNEGVMSLIHRYSGFFTRPCVGWDVESVALQGGCAERRGRSFLPAGAKRGKDSTYARPFDDANWQKLKNSRESFFRAALVLGQARRTRRYSTSAPLVA